MNHPLAVAGKYCLTGKIPLPLARNLDGEGKSSLPAPEQTHLKLGGALFPQQGELAPAPPWLLSSIEAVKTFLMGSFLPVFLLSLPLLHPGSYLPAHVLPHERRTVTNSDLWPTRRTR